MEQQTITTNRKRLDYIDLAKGFMILLVVAGHIVQCWFDKSDQEPLHAFLYSFHMPLFFLLSGYVMGGANLKKLSEQPFCKWLLKKVQTLVIPYVIWRLFVYRYIDPANASPLDMDVLWSVVTNSRSGGAWFLMSLFVVQLVSYPAFRYNKIHTWAIPAIYIIIGMLLGGNEYYCNPYYFASFIAGRFIFKYYKKVLKHDIATIALLGFVSFAWLHPNPMMLTLTAAVVLLYVCLQIEKKNEHMSFLYKKMIIIGQNTMAIYLLHVLFVFPVVAQHFDASDYRHTMMLTLTLILAFLVSLICVGVTDVVAFFPYINLMLFGKKNRI